MLIFENECILKKKKIECLHLELADQEVEELDLKWPYASDKNI